MRGFPKKQNKTTTTSTATTMLRGQNFVKFVRHEAGTK